ncbi:hypothetical protein [Nocardiopsis dassonvillei]|uniref:hypothetical protein n=1 Tax=Nocardiopsis dassonvillei TaxID=2014 RepID=UPI003636FB30
MASVSAIRRGLATRLKTISGLLVYDFVRGSVTAPAAVIKPGVAGREAVTFDKTFGRGSDALVFVVLLLVAPASDQVSQDSLDAYMDGDGTKSVKAAIEGDETLGGLVSFAHVVSVREYGLVEWGGVQYLGAQFVVEVTT